ncbi:hypothetical protein HAL07_15890 [Helicobacter ailurogastricus]|uniref:Uncharacterized protein n=1 Tax=Helicobacter ailurogastricus TaxID=1578720 RepID=A0A0K2Y5K2_9HELI|nr:hypothetical protein HAL07_15890 [Helicobacter ailurogastricus]
MSCLPLFLDLGLDLGFVSNFVDFVGSVSYKGLLWSLGCVSWLLFLETAYGAFRLIARFFGFRGT